MTAAIEEETGKERNNEQTQDRANYSASPAGESAAPAVIRGGTGAVTAAGAIVWPIRLDSPAILLAEYSP